MYREGPLPSLVLTGFNGHVIALERATGKEVWRFDSGRRHVSVELHLENDVLLVVAGKVVALLDAATGAVLRQTELEGDVEGPRALLLVEPDAIFVSHGGVLTCLERDVTVRWTNPLVGTGYGDPSLAVVGRSARLPASD